MSKQIYEDIAESVRQTEVAATRSERSAALAWQCHNRHPSEAPLAGAETMTVNEQVTARLRANDIDLVFHSKMTPLLKLDGDSLPLLVAIADDYPAELADLLLRLNAAHLRTQAALADGIAAMVIATADAGMLTIPGFRPDGRWPWSKRRSLLDGYTKPVTG